jgi:hypothetical protein
MSKEPTNQLATPEEMQEAIEASGYLLEGRIARLMSQRGFFVEQNAFHPDPADSSRVIEIDVVGRYFEWINEANKDSVTASLLVECKNNTQPFAFFTQSQQVTELNDNWIQYGGFPSFSMDPESKIQVPLHKLLEMKDWHHYCQTQEVATQFCSFARAKNESKNKPKSKWKAEPMKNYADSFAALARVTAFDSLDVANPHDQNIQIQLSYPVVVFQGPMYRVQEQGGKAKLELAEHLQLHHSTSVNGRMILAQIDVVREAVFTKLMETILSELITFRDKVLVKYDRLLNSALDQKRVAAQNAMRRSPSIVVS